MFRVVLDVPAPPDVGHTAIRSPPTGQPELERVAREVTRVIATSIHT
ncbi:MAG TPA: hypothetical protein VJN50_09040 [Actinomycetota bacterium]|nr:hypothetical protein [Actinomycetota bacterium]